VRAFDSVHDLSLRPRVGLQRAFGMPAATVQPSWPELTHPQAAIKA
jgi:hypothetical protein